MEVPEALVLPEHPDRGLDGEPDRLLDAPDDQVDRDGHVLLGIFRGLDVQRLEGRLGRVPGSANERAILVDALRVRRRILHLQLKRIRTWRSSRVNKVKPFPAIACPSGARVCQARLVPRNTAQCATAVRYRKLA